MFKAEGQNSGRHGGPSVQEVSNTVRRLCAHLADQQQVRHWLTALRLFFYSRWSVSLFFSSSPFAIRASPESSASVENLVIPSVERPVAGSLLQMSRRLVGLSTINTYIQNNEIQTFIFVNEDEDTSYTSKNTVIKPWYILQKIVIL